MSRTHGWGRWTAVAILVLVAGLFSFLNAGERVALDLGFRIVYRISLVGLVFGSFLSGMIAMFLFGLRHDRRIRNALRAHYKIHLAEEDHPTLPQSNPHD